MPPLGISPQLVLSWIGVNVLLPTGRHWPSTVASSVFHNRLSQSFSPGHFLRRYPTLSWAFCPAVQLTGDNFALGKKHDHDHATTKGQKRDTGFSVVLFRPHCMLVSEEFPMKSHKNQWVWSMLCPPEHLAGAISRVQILVSGVQTPSQCPDTGLSPRQVRLQALENKALSCGIRGKSAPILAEITIRKSQDITIGSYKAGRHGD
jgi:hypothetical protein